MRFRNFCCNDHQALSHDCAVTNNIDLDHPIPSVTTGLLHCVKAIVLCFFSIDDCVHSEHFKYDAHNDPRINYVVGDCEHIFMYVIGHFSQPKSVVLDLTGSHTEGTTVHMLYISNSCRIMSEQDIHCN